MWITHSYLGTTRGAARCLFFLLYKDYVDTQLTFAKDFDQEIERFARNLGEAGVVVKPFLGDIENTHSSFLEKAWTPPQIQPLQKTPAMLMIDVDFKAFDPRNNRWVLLTFGDSYWHSQDSDKAQLRALLKHIAEAVLNYEIDPFEIALEAVRRQSLKRGSEIFNLRPGMFGISIDLRALGHKLKELYRHPLIGKKNV